MTLPLSGPISLHAIADEFAIARSTPFPSGFYGKGGAPASGVLTFSDFYGRTGATLSASASPDLCTGSGSLATITSNSSTCTAANGVPPYTYAWVKVSGDAISAVSGSSATTQFRAVGMASRETRAASFICTVTDAVAATVDSNTVNVSLDRL
jgi:hypothetical protein